MLPTLFDESDYVLKGGLVSIPGIRLDVDPVNEGGSLIHVIHDAAN